MNQLFLQLLHIFNIDFC